MFPILLSFLSLAPSAAAAPSDFDVVFEDCTEFAGIGFVPYDSARALVPSSYTLASDGVDAIAVVRVVDCASVTVDGHAPSPARLSQIGITVIGPDAAADIDNYTLWYVTDDPLLHAKLQAIGADNVHDSVVYDIAPDGAGGAALEVGVSPPQGPDHTVLGTVILPTSAPTSFVARWWREGPHGTVLMHTVLPDIRFSSASTSLETSAGSELAALIGSASMTFPILDSYNAFSVADMAVTLP